MCKVAFQKLRKLFNKKVKMDPKFLSWKSELNKYLDKIDTQLDLFTRSNSGVNISQNKNSIMFLLEYLLRCKSNLKSISILLSEEKIETEFENAIGLIIRCSLSDFISLLYIDDISNNHKDVIVFEENCRKLQFDHFNNMDLSKEARAKYKDVIEIKENGKIKSKYGEFPSVSKIKRIIKDKIKPYFLSTFDNWNWYSKYEHFGYMTYFIIRIDPKINYETHLKSLNLVLNGIKLVMEILENIEPKLKLKNLDSKYFKTIWEEFSLFLYNEKIIVLPDESK